MEKYIIIKELPDANVGTEVIWDEKANAFCYEKSCWVSPYLTNHLTAGQVTQTPEYFLQKNIYEIAREFKRMPIIDPEEPDIFTPTKQKQVIQQNMEKFRKDLEELINKYSMENGSNTPDFILSEYLINCLKAFDSATIGRTLWHQSDAINNE